MNPGTGPLGLFHKVRPESLLKSPVHVTWTPKYAIVDSRLMFQLGYPIVGSARLLAKAKPNTSRKSRGLARACNAMRGWAAAGKKADGAAVASRWAESSMVGGAISLSFESAASVRLP